MVLLIYNLVCRLSSTKSIFNDLHRDSDRSGRFFVCRGDRVIHIDQDLGIDIEHSQDSTAVLAERNIIPFAGLDRAVRCRVVSRLTHGGDTLVDHLHDGRFVEGCCQRLSPASEPHHLRLLFGRLKSLNTPLSDEAM